MAAVLVQSKLSAQIDNTGGTTLAFTSSVTAGNSVIVTITRVNPLESKTFTVTQSADSVALTNAVNVQFASDLSESAHLFYRHNAVAGANFAVGISPTSASGSYYVMGFEVSGLQDIAPTTGSKTDESATSSHTDSSSGLSGTGFVVTAAVTSASRNHTAGAGYTKDLPPGSEVRFTQHLIGTVTTNLGPHTTDGATTRGNGVMGVFPELSGLGVGALLAAGKTASLGLTVCLPDEL